MFGEPPAATAARPAKDSAGTARLLAEA